MNNCPIAQLFSSDALEPRTHLAADFAMLGRTGTITLLGTPAADHYEIRSISPGANEQIEIESNGQFIRFPQRNVSRLSFDGGAGDDFVEIDPRTNSFKTTLRGGDGRDTLVGGQYFDLIFGGAGADLLKGGNQRDTIYGEGGNDRIFGNAFDDRLFGGPGNDRINGGPGDDYIDAGRGDDAITTAGGDDTVFGGSGIDVGLDLSSLVTSPDGVESILA